MLLLGLSIILLGLAISWKANPKATIVLTVLVVVVLLALGLALGAETQRPIRNWWVPAC